MRKRILGSLLLGTLATAAGMAVSFEYCSGGPGYGIPAAIIHPSHQEWWLIPLNAPAAVEGLAFDPLSLAINIVLLSLVIFGIATAIARGKRKKTSALASPRRQALRP